MRKLGKLYGIYYIFRAKIIAFALISHCFFPNFPLLLPEFPTASARIFRFQTLGGGGGGAQCLPPTPMDIWMHLKHEFLGNYL